MNTTLISALILSCLTLFSPGPKPADPFNIAIPQQEDWIDHGMILDSGAEGDWDLYLWGGFANSVVKKDGLYYLYYQGSNGYDEVEGTVTYRSIGLATSEDGINFTKYPGNPVLTWFPNDHLEEGAVSAGASLSPQGEVVIYYGANTWAGGSRVKADGRLALSSDGVNFHDAGVVLDHTERSIWGYGDEIFPVISFSENGRWYVYYIPNGVPQSGLLGVAWGNEIDKLEDSSAVVSDNRPVPAWGQGGYAKIGEGAYALFTNNSRAPGGAVIEARTFTLDKPNLLSKPVAEYRFEGISNASVYLDQAQMKWFMVYRSANFEGYGVKTAPLVFVDEGDGTQDPDESVFLPILKR